MPVQKNCSFCNKSSHDSTVVALSSRMKAQLHVKTDSEYFVCLLCLTEEGAIDEYICVNTRGHKRVRADVDIPTRLSLNVNTERALGEHHYSQWSGEKENEMRRARVDESDNGVQRTVGESGYDDNVEILDPDLFMSNESELVIEIIVEEPDEACEDGDSEEEVCNWNTFPFYVINLVVIPNHHCVDYFGYVDDDVRFIDYKDKEWALL